MTFITVYQDEAEDPSRGEAYSTRVIEVPENWLDDPFSWAAHYHPERGKHIIMCAPEGGWQALVAAVEKRKR